MELSTRDAMFQSVVECFRMGGENLVDQMADFHNWVPLSTALVVQRVDQIDGI